MTDEITFRHDVTVQNIDVMGDDDSILRAMLVSTGTDQSVQTMDNPAKGGRINYLMKNRHGSPFEHGAMTFYVEAPIFVFREFHRHRIGFSYNEISGRYSELPPTFYVPGEVRPLVQTGKPGAYVFGPGTHEQWGNMQALIEASCSMAYKSYQHMLNDGVAKEVARMCLPVNIFSAMYVTCNPRSMMAFLSLRTRAPEGAALFPSTPMREIEMVAEKMEDVFSQYFPMTHGAFCANKRVGP